MNCKPGDLAIVVRSRAGNLGKVVRCERLATEADLDVAGVTAEGPAWVVDKPMALLGERSGRLRHIRLAPDSHLRPIRDQGDDAVDETLLWFPAPKKKQECPYSPHKEAA